MKENPSFHFSPSKTSNHQEATMRKNPSYYKKRNQATK